MATSAMTPALKLFPDDVSKMSVADTSLIDINALTPEQREKLPFCRVYWMKDKLAMLMDEKEITVNIAYDLERGGYVICVTPKALGKWTVSFDVCQSNENDLDESWGARFIFRGLYDGYSKRFGSSDANAVLLEGGCEYFVPMPKTNNIWVKFQPTVYVQEKRQELIPGSYNRVYRFEDTDSADIDEKHFTLHLAYNQAMGGYSMQFKPKNKLEWSVSFSLYHPNEELDETKPETITVFRGHYYGCDASILTKWYPGGTVVPEDGVEKFFPMQKTKHLKLNLGSINIIPGGPVASA